MTIALQSDALHERVRQVIATDGTPPVSLVQDIASYQREHIEPIRRLATTAPLTADDGFAALPGVVTEAYRYARIAAHPPELDVAVFRTSGTTSAGVAPGEHPMRTVATYELAASRWGRRHLLTPELRGTIMLAPSSEQAPSSSLSHMIDLFADQVGGIQCRGVDADFGLRLDNIQAACEQAREQRAPILVMATAFALVALFDAADIADLTLPPGSRVMYTGGFKGRTREIPWSEMRQQIASAFSVASADIIGEYGMTELSSQLYELPLNGEHPIYAAPPWLIVTAVDPDTLTPLPDGQEGLARFVDLANVDSSLAVQTADRIIVTDAGITLLGRASGATPRGCSLAMEELLMEQHGR